MSTSSKRVPWGKLFKDSNVSLGYSAPGPPPITQPVRGPGKSGKKANAEKKTQQTTKFVLLVACVCSVDVSYSEIDSWNPMEEEYTSPTLSKYSSGPGMALQSSKRVDDSNKSKYGLYVTNIPVGLTNVSL